MAPIERIDTPDLYPPTGYSHVVRHGNTAYIAGAAGIDREGNFSDDPEEQIRTTIENLEVALATVGADLSNLVKWTIYLTSTEHIGAWRNVRSTYIGDDIRPAGALLIIDALALPGLIVEIEAIAALDA